MQPVSKNANEIMMQPYFSPTSLGYLDGGNLLHKEMCTHRRASNTLKISGTTTSQVRNLCPSELTLNARKNNAT